VTLSLSRSLSVICFELVLSLGYRLWLLLNQKKFMLFLRFLNKIFFISLTKQANINIYFEVSIRGSLVTSIYIYMFLLSCVWKLTVEDISKENSCLEENIKRRRVAASEKANKTIRFLIFYILHLFFKEIFMSSLKRKKS
jgi:hypothetical protein